jgi:hypothetical protein
MKYYIERIFSILAAILFLQTLYFKFSGAPESLYIFSQLGLEPYGRIGVGVIEFFVAFLLLFRKTALTGAIFGIIIIVGAIYSHLFILGIEILNDRGFLFGLAIIILISCIISVQLQWVKLTIFIKS